MINIIKLRKDLLPKPPTCKGCPLFGDGFGFSRTRGEGKEKILIFGEALGEEEELAGIAFVGKTGSFLSRIISRTIDPETNLPLSIDRDFWVRNTVMCRPPNNDLAPYEKEAVEKCRRYALEAIEELKPRVIVAVGGVALKALTGRPEGIDTLRGYVFRGPKGLPVIGTYHPSYLIRGKVHLSRVVKLDLLKAVQVARHGLPERVTRYTLNPSPFDLLRFVEDYETALAGTPDLPLAFDIETPYVKKAEKDEDPYNFSIEDDESFTILRISFSFKEGEAITFQWREPFISLAVRLLSSPGPKIAFNGLNFDVPRLEANNCPIEGDFIDVMHEWKCLESALPMSLRFVVSVLLPDAEPWKLEVREKPEFYSASDSDLLLRAHNKIRAKLEAEGRWNMFLRHFVRCGTVLKRMSRRGIRVDKERRQAARETIEAWLKERERAVQKVVPIDLCPRKTFMLPLETLEKKGYKREQLLLVDDRVEELKKGWRLSEEGYLERIPKEKKPRAARAVKEKSPRSSSGSTKRGKKTASSSKDETSQSAMSASGSSSQREREG